MRKCSMDSGGCGVVNDIHLLWLMCVNDFMLRAIIIIIAGSAS